MTSPQSVIVYAASGYTGKLVCEWLTRLGVPFVAAGRNLAKLEAVAREMRARGADCSAAACEHTPAGLNKLLTGAKVVINISGPFSLLGHAVVDAALAQGVHYLDSTGEQDFMFDLRRDYHARFEKKKLVLAPSTAFLWTPGAAAAELCLEQPGIDSVSIAYAPPSLQTVASLQSMIRSARRPGYFIEGGRLTRLPPADVRDVTLPSGEVRRGLRVGAGETTFFQGDPRVLACDTIFTSNDLARVAPFFGVWQKLSSLVDGDTLDKISDAMVEKLKKDPELEDERTQQYVINVIGEGRNGQRARVTLDGHSPYASTGFLAAMSAQSLLEGKIKRVGYVSLAQALGAKQVLARMEEIGTRTTVEVSGPKSGSAKTRAANA